MRGSGLHWTDYFQKFCGSGQDRIPFYLIRTGRGLKIFPVRSSLLLMMTHISGCSHPAWNLIRPRFWWCKARFGSTRRSQWCHS